MPGSSPGTPAQASIAADGTVTYVDPATSSMFAGLPAGSAGALMLQGPQAPPPAPAQVRRVMAAPPVPGTPGRLQRLPNGMLAVTPSGLIATAAAGGSTAPKFDPPMGAAPIAGMADGSVAVLPLPAAYNGDDAQILNVAALQAAGPGGTAGGIVRLQPGATYQWKSNVVLPANLLLTGNCTTVLFSGAGSAVLVPSFLNPSNTPHMNGGIQGLILDGTAAAAGAIGLDMQDLNGYQLNISVQNFSGAGSVGVRVANNNFSINQLAGYCRISNCTTGLLFTTLGSQTAIEHINVIWSIGCQAGQAAIVLANSVGVQGSFINASVSSVPSSGPVFTFGAGCVFSNCTMLFKAELTNPATTAQTVVFAGGGSGWSNSIGTLFFSANYLTSNIGTAGGTFTFVGGVPQDATLQNAALGGNTFFYGAFA